MLNEKFKVHLLGRIDWGGIPGNTSPLDEPLWGYLGERRRGANHGGDL